jgi:hypothetical protein
MGLYDLNNGVHFNSTALNEKFVNEVIAKKKQLVSATATSIKL